MPSKWNELGGGVRGRLVGMPHIWRGELDSLLDPACPRLFCNMQCTGLVKSRSIVCVLSRGAINHATEPRQSFPMLTADSPCDNGET